MRFGVVVCPHCRRALVVELRSPTPTCRSCGKGFDLTTRKSFYQGDDAGAAREHAGRLAAELAGAGGAALEESMLALDREHRARVEDVVEALEAREEFGAEEVQAEIGRLKVAASADRVLWHLRAANRLYEPRPGRFRWLA